MVDAPSSLGGGKFKGLVKDLINAERQPIRLLETKKVRENDRLKLLQEFQGKVKKIEETYRELDSFRKFKELKADWPDKNLMDVALDKDVAEPGEYQLEIIQLAGRHSMISNGYESTDDEVGVGYFTYDLPDGETKSVYIGEGNNTVKGLVRAINAEKDLGVQASLINDGSGDDEPWRVVIHAKKTGINNDIEYPEFYFLDGDFRFMTDDERPAQNAIIKFDGFEVMSQSNRFELLPGVTIDLKEAKEDHEFTLNITSDIAKIAAKVKALVDALNGTLDFVYKQNKVDQSSDTSRTLTGDSALFTIESRLRTWVFENFNVDEEDENIVMRLGDIGIRFEKTGQLTFNEDAFKKKLFDNFDYVASLFAGEDHFIPQLKNLTQGILAADNGILGAREKGIRDRIKSIDKDIANKESNLVKREEQLKRQFAQLEGFMGSMQSQQQYLSQAMGQMQAQ